MKKKMAYLMHVDINWIKQRPHFLAEKLARFYEIDLFYVQDLKSQKTADYTLDSLLTITKLNKFPFSCKSKFLQKIETRLNMQTLNKIYSGNYDYIWLTSPLLLQFIDITKLSRAIIIYDCMDDVLEFPLSNWSKAYYEQLEQKLFRYGNIVLATSAILEDKVRARGFLKKVYLVNNAVNPKSLQLEATKKLEVQGTGLLNILYFGTISEWFDFELVSKLLDTHQDIVFTIIGPTEITLPRHERIKYFGPVKHEELKGFAAQADAFIMPFKLNELIKAVDPVKVYEYIALMKPTFVLKYNETLKFQDFVYLYEGFSDLSAKINEVKKHSVYNVDRKKVKKFIEENSWKNRAKQIYEILEQLV